MREKNHLIWEKHHIPLRARKGFVMATPQLLRIDDLREVRGRTVRPFNERAEHGFADLMIGHDFRQRAWQRSSGGLALTADEAQDLDSRLRDVGAGPIDGVHARLEKSGVVL